MFIPLLASVISPGFYEKWQVTEKNHPKMSYSTMLSAGKMIHNPYLGLDRYQKLTDSTHW